ncbi:MAG: hypothetical protein HWE35_21245 [Rhodobacteraceae bacterium]|nr:hypothetical protein [Paracoccaceae bacterium]
MSSLISGGYQAAAMTGAEIKTSYEAQPDTNALNNVRADKLDRAAEWVEDFSALSGLSYGSGAGQVQAGVVVRTRKKGFAYEVADSGATDQHLTTAGGVKLYVTPIYGPLHPVFPLDAMGILPGVDATAQFDTLLSWCWANYTVKYTILIPHDTILTKNGDFVIPPNVSLAGVPSRSRLRLGHASARVYFKRDNSRVGTVGGVDYTQDGNYWSLGPNVMRDLTVCGDVGVAVSESVFISDLIQFTAVNCQFSGDGQTYPKAQTAIHFQNDAKWTEYWNFDNCTVEGAVNGFLFSRTPGSAYASFGHGVFQGVVHARENGAACARVTEGASPYNGKWVSRGFVSAPTAGQEAYLFKLEGAGSDMSHTYIDAAVENLGNNGTPYAVHVDTAAGASGEKITGRLRGVGSATKFRGLSSNDFLSFTTNRIDEDGNSQTGGNGKKFRVSGAADVNGDNLLTYADQKVIYFTDEPAANGRFGIIPTPRSGFAQAIGIQLDFATAGSGNTGGVWHLGLVKDGAANPSKVVTIPDGETSVYLPLEYTYPAGWAELSGNDFIWKSADGSGNDGTPPGSCRAAFYFLDY